MAMTRFDHDGVSPGSTPTTTPQSIQFYQGARKNKVRTGCNTCKIRHIKCDESKPDCLRCSKSGRRCDYTRVMPQVVEAWGDPEERRALHLYRETAGPEMSNYFDGPFWTATVLRISHESPAAKHILMATGSIYEYLMRTSQTIVPPQEFALIQISKSIVKLMNGKTNLVTILTCMILFVACGNLMDDMSSMRHLKSGLQIVREIQRSSDHPYWTGLTTSERELVNGLLIPMTYRLARFVHLLDPVGVLTDSLRAGNINVSTCKPRIPSIFTNIRQAEECHNHLYQWALSHLRPADTLSGYEIETKDEKAIYRESQAFMRAIDGFIAQLEMNHSKPSKSIAAAAALLKVDHFATRLILKATNFTRETEYDQMEDAFREIFRGCRKFLKIADTRQHSLTRKLYFGTDNSFLISLFLVARTTRDPVLRREVIGLLGTSDVAEGMLGSRTAALVASVIMQIEESGLSLVTCASDIPECNRIRPHSGAFFMYVTPCPQLRLDYCRYPYLRGEDGQMVTESVWIPFTRERPAFWDSQEEVLFQKDPGPRSTPFHVEQIIERDLKTGQYPDFMLSRGTVTWADRSTSPPTYDSIQTTHPIFEQQHLRF